MLRRNSIRLAEVTIITEIEQSRHLTINHAFYGPKKAYLARFGDFFIPCNLACRGVSGGVGGLMYFLHLNYFTSLIGFLILTLLSGLDGRVQAVLL